MTKSKFKFPSLTKIKQGIAGSLAAVFFFTNVAGLHATESNFWADRRRAAQESRGVENGSSPIQLASAGDFASRFPHASPVAFGGVAPTAGGGLDGNASLSVSALPRPAGLTHDQDWLVQAVAPFGTIQDAHFSSSKSPLIVHIQDAHGILDAQRNTASIILELQKARGIQLVGLEGAAGGFQTDAFRSINEAPITRKIAEDMLVEGALGGAEYAGLVAEKAPLLWGVENLADYHANIEAYKIAAKEAATFKYRVAGFSKAVDALKPTYYSSALQEFDRYQSAYREKGDGLASYVSYLLRTPVGTKANVPQLRRLKDAMGAEATLDFKEVESERRHLVEALAKHMSSAALETLVKQSVLFRGGQLSHTAFHKSLMAAARANGIRVESFPQFNAYIRYVESAEQIRQADLFDELTGLETRAQADLAKGENEKQLMAASRSVLLLEKLGSQAMSPSDWAEYLDRRPATLTLAETLRALAKSSDVSALPTWPEMETALKPFEDFCRYATVRNQGLTQNLLEKMKSSNSAGAVLVAGGFHTDGLVKMFKAKDLSYVVVTPKIQEVPKENHYLEAFTRDARPLEKILTGERIFLVSELSSALSTSPEGRQVTEAGVINRSAVFTMVQPGVPASKIIDQLNQLAERMARADLSRVKKVEFGRQGEVITLTDPTGHGVHYTLRCGPTATFADDVFAPLKKGGELKENEDGQPVNFVVSQAGPNSFVIFQEPSSKGILHQISDLAKNVTENAKARAPALYSSIAKSQQGYSSDPKYLLLLATTVAFVTTLFAPAAVSALFPVATLILAVWTVTLFFPQSLVALPVKRLIKVLRFDRRGPAQDLLSRAENALAPARGVERVGSALEEKLSIMYGLGIMSKEDYLRAMEIKDQALAQIRTRLEKGEIDLSVRIRTSMSQPEVEPIDRKIKVGVYPIAGNPPHWSHLLAPLVAMAEQGLDKVYVLPQGFDRRKKETMPLEELLARHEMNQRALLEVYGSWIEYAATGVGNEYDGEINIRRIAAMNPNQKMDLYYMVGADHYAFKANGGAPDTLWKLFRPMKSVPVILEDGSKSNLGAVIKAEFPKYNPQSGNHALRVIFIERVERITQNDGTILERDISMEKAESVFPSSDLQMLKDQKAFIFKMASLLNVSSSAIRNGDKGSFPFMVVSYLSQAPASLRGRMGITMDEIKRILDWKGVVFPRGPPVLTERAKNATSPDRAVERVGSALEEKLSAMFVAGHMSKEDYQAALDLKDRALGQIRERLEKGEIDPSVRIRTSRSQSEVEPVDKKLKVGVYPIAGNPPHWSHLLAPLVAMAEQGLDKVVILPQGFDRRKEHSMPHSELSARHEMNQRVLMDIYGTWVEYAATGLTNSYDGETNIRRIAAMNPEQKMDLYYMVGADHFAFDTKSGQADTLGKLFRPMSEVMVMLPEGNVKTVAEIVAFDFPTYNALSGKHVLKVIFIERIERTIQEDGSVLEKNISMVEAEKGFSDAEKQSLAQHEDSIYRMEPLLNVSSSEIRNGGKGALPFMVVEYLRQSPQALRKRVNIKMDEINGILNKVNKIKTQSTIKSKKERGFLEIAVLFSLATVGGLLVIAAGFYLFDYSPDWLSSVVQWILGIAASAKGLVVGMAVPVTHRKTQDLSSGKLGPAYFTAKTLELPLILDGARSPSEYLKVTLNPETVPEGEHLLAVFPGGGRTFVGLENDAFSTRAPISRTETLLLLNSNEQVTLIGAKPKTRAEALIVLGRTEQEQRELEESVLAGLAFDSGALTSNVPRREKSFGSPWVEVTGDAGNIQVPGKETPSNTPGGVAVAPSVEFVNVNQDLTRVLFGNLGTLVDASRAVEDASAPFINPRLNLDLNVERNSINAKIIVNGHPVQSFDLEMNQDAVRLLTMAKYYSDLGEFERALAGSNELVAERLAAQKAGNESVPRVMEALGYHLGLLAASGMNHHRLTRIYASALGELVQNDETIVHLIRSAPVFEAAFALGRKAEVYSSKDMSWLGHMGSYPNAQVSPVLYVTDENRSTVGDLVVRAVMGVRTTQKEGVVTIFLMSDNEDDVAQANDALGKADQNKVEVKRVAATGEKGVLYPSTEEGKTQMMVFSDATFLGALPALGIKNAADRVAKGEWVFPVISNDENLDLSQVSNKEAFFLARLIGSIALVIRSAEIYNEIDGLRRALVAA